MIFGAKEWSLRQHHYSQENNPQEEMLRKAGVADWLETCGPTSAVNCIAVLGHDLEIKAPGPFRPQPESVLSGWFHDPRNYSTMEEIRAATPPHEWMGNRIPQFYPAAVRSLFGVEAVFRWLDTEGVKNAVMSGRAVQVCLKKPSHYIAIVAYDDETEEFIFNDSYPSRKDLKNRGFNERIKNLHIQQWGVVYE